MSVLNNLIGVLRLANCVSQDSEISAKNCIKVLQNETESVDKNLKPLFTLVVVRVI
jgi:hypothetical protein